MQKKKSITFAQYFTCNCCRRELSTASFTEQSKQINIDNWQLQPSIISVDFETMSQNVLELCIVCRMKLRPFDCNITSQENKMSHL